MVSEPTRFRLEVATGQHVVGDQLPGQAPGYLFLHGLGSERGGEKSNQLLHRARVRGQAFTRYDARGHGESSGTIGRLLLSDAIHDAQKVLRHAGRSVLVGSSLGGLVATYLATREPHLVSALAVIAPAYGFLRRLIARCGAQQPFVQLGDGRRFDLHPDFVGDAAKFDEFSLASALRVPVFLVHGEMDDIVPPQASRDFFALLQDPRKHLWIVPGGDHRLNLQAESIFENLDSFLAKHT